MVGDNVGTPGKTGYWSSIPAFKGEHVDVIETTGQ